MEIINNGNTTNPDQEIYTKKLPLTLRPSIYAQLETEAKQRGRSLNDTIEDICHNYLTMPIICTMMTVTPKTAKEWLTHNAENNRHINGKRVKMYAEDMKNNKWKLTHQGVAFDADGQLIDGQHRLEAVIKSGVPVRMLVMWYRYRVQEGALLAMDLGAARTTKNIFTMSGIDDNTFLSGIGLVRAFFALKLGDHDAKSPDAIMDYIGKHKDEISKIVEWYIPKGKRKKTPTIVAAAALSALYWGESQDAIRRFGKTWTSNDAAESGKYNSKIVFDTKDMIAKNTKTADTLRYCENAIRAYANGLSRFRPLDCYPLDEMKMQVE